MRKKSFAKLFAASAFCMVFCLILLGTSTNLFAQRAAKDSEANGEDQNQDRGRRMSRAAQEALVEAQRRLNTNPEDFAAARQPLLDFMASSPEAMPDETNPIPLVMYQMLGQLWYTDQNSKNHVDEARKIYKEGHEAYPDDEMLLLNYAVTTYELEKFLDAAPLFEKFYEVSAKHEVKYLSYAAAAYYSGEDLKSAKRVFVRMINSVETPESTWLESVISICNEQQDIKETDKYIGLALKYYPMEQKYWNLMGNSFLNKEDYRGAASAFEIASRVQTPDKGSQWKSLIDLYNYLGLPLRTAETIQDGFKLLVKSGQEDDEYALVAEAYARGERIDKAISYLDGIIAKNGSAKLMLKKGKILFDAGRSKEAIAALDECVAKDPKAWDAYYMKGWACWDLKDWKGAKEAFDKALSSKDYRAQAQDAIDMIASLDEAKSK
jgi:tetratricopeptide (TPR) repeat protein